MKLVLKRSKNARQITNKLVLVVICLLLSQDVLHAQDPTFTQFYANPLYLNPAFAGSNNCPRFALNYRNEWPNLSGNYTTYSASYDQHIKNISGGIGVLVTHDEQGQGTIKTNMLGLIYSYHLKITRKFSIRFPQIERIKSACFFSYPTRRTEKKITRISRKSTADRTN